jgi:hypothetical protein
MAKTYTVTEYEKEDIEKLDNMTNEEVIETLEYIKGGWLPQNYVCSPEYYKTYSESQYETTKLHKAMSKAIDMLERCKDIEDKNYER